MSTITHSICRITLLGLVGVVGIVYEKLHEDISNKIILHEDNDDDDNNNVEKYVNLCSLTLHVFYIS